MCYNNITYSCGKTKKSYKTNCSCDTKKNDANSSFKCKDSCKCQTNCSC